MCWSARELCKLLGYHQWRNFISVIDKAKEACKNVGQLVSDHFADVSRMVQLGSNAERDIDDVMLTRYACYLYKRGLSPFVSFYSKVSLLRLSMYLSIRRSSSGMRMFCGHSRSQRRHAMQWSAWRTVGIASL